MNESVLILDFGSQYTQLIARRVRECGVFSEIKPCTIAASAVDLSSVKAIILSGGPASVLDQSAPAFDSKWFESGVPILGVCYGMQLMAQQFGGSLDAGESREYGRSQLKITDNSPLFSGLDKSASFQVWMSHGDHVSDLPRGFTKIAESPGAPYSAMANSQNNLYGIQFHPEVMHTENGTQILRNFLFEISKMKGDWTADNFISSTIKQISARVSKDENVICGLSGGVDSSVAAVLVNQAISDRLHCIYVNNGLMRKNESENVDRMLGKNGIGLNLTIVDASQQFLSALKGVSDPEEKRKIIGHTFIDVFNQEASKVGGAKYLVQGTLYPDVIESESVRGPSAVIKSHHNVGGLPEKMALELIEPFRELFKDEVREIGRSLKIPNEIISRQPFPGPGLGVRILGEITKELVSTLQAADAILDDEIRKAGLYESLWQSFMVLLPVKSVGVMGDDRTYERAAVIRAVNSVDGMTADWAYLPETLLRKVSSRIINEVKGINRVTLDISSKPPSTIEWE
ncbi:MAG: glutamine-hydrolyzing GMP synthase [Bdellovibrionota bacterium]